ncbi:MAG: methyltransferase domain-containing protein [Bacteroidota bacterium]|nr:methyltransferase domain-containing protein [Bacteroidota bacterium]
MLTLKRTATGFFWNQIGRTIEYVLVFLFSVLIARQLGAEINGIYATLLSIVFLLLTVSSFGLETSITSTFPRAYKSLPEAASAFRGLLIFRVIYSILIASIFLIFRSIVVEKLNVTTTVCDYLFVIVFYFVLRSIISLFSSTLIAFFEIKINSLLGVATRTIELICVYLIISSGLGLKQIFGLIAATSILQLLAYIVIFREILFLRATFVPVKSAIILGGKFWLNSMIEFALGKQMDIILLGLFAVSLRDIGNFDVAFTFSQALNQGLTIGFFGVSVATFSSLESKAISRIKAYTESLIRFVILVVTPVIFFVGIYAHSILPLLYSNEYLNSILLFQIFVGVIIVSRIIGGGVTADYLFSKDETQKLIFSSVIGGVINVSLAVILIPLYGVLGTALATTTAILTTTSLHAYFVRRAISIKFQIKFSLLVITICVLSAALTSLITQTIVNVGPILAFALYCIFFILISALIKPIRAVDAKNISNISNRLFRLVSIFSKSEYLESGLTDRQKWAYAWLPNTDFVLDIGCSNSPLVGLLPNKSKFAIGIDTDLDAIKSISGNDPQINLIQAKAESLPVRNEVADVVLLLDVLEHTDDERMVISEIHRVLKPNGLLIMSIPYKGLFSFLDPQNLSEKLKSKEQVLLHRHYSDKELRRLLFRLFKIEKKHYGGLFLYPVTFWAANFFKKRFRIDLTNFYKKIGDIDNDISWGKLSYNLIIKARKI